MLHVRFKDSCTLETPNIQGILSFIQICLCFLDFSNLIYEKIILTKEISNLLLSFHMPTYLNLSHSQALTLTQIKMPDLTRRRVEMGGVEVWRRR